MKVVQINAVYEYSSTGRIVQTWHNKLKSNGDESFVFCSNAKDVSDGIFCMGTPFSRKMHGLLSRITGLQGYFSKKATAEMLRKLDDIKPDIVHLGNLHGNYIHVNMLLDYLVKNQIATFVTLHDCWLFTGHCCHFLEDNCDRWQYGCGKCPAKHKWNKSWFFDRSAKVLRDRKERFSKLKNLTVGGVSDWITDLSRKSFFKENARFLRIYNWINLNVFTLKQRPGNKTPVVLSVAQGWSDVKGLSDILKVAETNPEYKFVMVGNMPETVKLPANVHSVGAINNINALAEQYKNADVLLHLSHQESFGNVIAEALACGTPAIVYDTTAMPELIGPGCGAVVPKGDWEAAGRAIPDVLNCNLKDCRSFVEANFEINRLLDDWIREYRAAIDKTKSED